MLGNIEVQTYGGPYDGLRMHITATPSFVFEERGSDGVPSRRVVYALEVTEEGFFRLRHLTTQENP